MPTKVYDRPSLKSYYTDDTTDTAEFEQWLLENESNPDADAMLRELLDDTRVTDDAAADKAFGLFRSRTGLDTSARHANSRNYGRSIMHGVRNMARWTQRVAALAALPLAAALVYMLTQISAPTEWVEVYTAGGETRTVVLPDNSTICLNSYSRLVYPEKFDGESRHVFLQGEAYANISRDESAPFVISAGEIDVTVLGTQFNICSYVEDSECEVALVEGSVKIGVNKEGNGGNIMLKPGEIAKYDKLTGMVSRHNFIPNYYRPLVDGGGFMFVNQRFRDIATSLARHFNAKILIEDESVANERYYASFINDESLEQILQTLNAQGDLDISRRGEVIFITRKH